MDWTRYEALSREWTEKTRDYVRALNDFVARGLAGGFDEAGEEPVDPRTPELGAQVVDVVREANAAGAWRELRARFPTAHAPFIDFLKEKSVTFRSVRFIDDTRVVAAVGSAWRPEAVLVLDFDGEVAHAPGGALDVGSSPDRGHFALLYDDHVLVTEGWGGAEVGRFPRPRGDEGVVEGVETFGDDEPPASVHEMVVLPGGNAVAMATSCGVFLTSAEGVRRLSPDAEQLAEIVAAGGDDDGPYEVRTDMTHVAVHPGGALIACGHQSSQHELRAPDGTLVAAFGPLFSEYPHHAAFSPDGERAIFNSCHFYSGATIIARVEELRGLRLPEWAEDARLLPLQGGARVYASSFHEGAYLLGDAHGYVRAMYGSGDFAWQHFTGSSLGGIDVSPDGRRLAVGTYAGFLSLCELDEAPDPFQIGTGPFRERIRYVRWAGEPLWRW